MNNQGKFVCLWCCVLPGFVVELNNFFSLVLLFAVIHKRRGEKLISETIKYKLDSSSERELPFFYPKDIQNFFWKTIDFVENLEMTQIAGGGGGGKGGVITIINNVHELSSYIERIKGSEGQRV